MRGCTVFTCSVYPDVTRVWYHFAARNLRSAGISVLVYDCGSHLDPRHFPGARVVAHPNKEHGKKIDHAVAHHVGTDLMFVLDDDAFVLDPAAVTAAVGKFEESARLAAYSFKNRDFWQINVNGAKRYPMGSYAVILRKDVLVEHGISAASVPTDNPMVRNGTGYYDTLDYANEQLLRLGYEVEIAEASDQDTMPTFFGTSSGFLTFVKRRLFTRRYALIGGREECMARIMESSYNVQRACAIAAVIELHRAIFREDARFVAFPSLDEIEAQAAGCPDGEERNDRLKAVHRVRRLLARLVSAA